MRPLGKQATAWAQAALKARGVEALRVLQGLLHLADRHAAEAIDEACGIALSHACYQLRTIRQLLQWLPGENRSTNSVHHSTSYWLNGASQQRGD